MTKLQFRCDLSMYDNGEVGIFSFNAVSRIAFLLLPFAMIMTDEQRKK